MALPTNYTATSPWNHTETNNLTTDVNANTIVIDANNDYLVTLQAWADQL